jgi:hypothetical protein
MSRSLLSPRLRTYLSKANLATEFEIQLLTTMLLEAIEDLKETNDALLLDELRTELNTCFQKLVGQVAVVQPVKERFHLGRTMDCVWNALMDIAKYSSASMEAEAKAKHEKVRLRAAHEKYRNESRQRHQERVTPEQLAILDERFLRTFLGLGPHLRTRLVAFFDNRPFTVRDVLMVSAEQFEARHVFGPRTREEFEAKLAEKGFKIAHLYIPETELARPWGGYRA